MIVGLYQWAITIGLLLAAIVNESTKDKTTDASWHIPIAVQFAWGAILAGGMLCLPESPRYLLLKGRDAQAKASMARLTGHAADSTEVEQECLDIQMALDVERELGKTSYLDCFRGGEAKNGLRTMTGIMIQGMQQLTGINFVSPSLHSDERILDSHASLLVDLLLRNHLLQAIRYQQPLHHHHHYQRCEHS